MTKKNDTSTSDVEYAECPWTGTLEEMPKKEEDIVNDKKQSNGDLLINTCKDTYRLAIIGG